MGGFNCLMLGEKIAPERQHLKNVSSNVVALLLDSLVYSEKIK